MTQYLRVFEGHSVPATFEDLLVPAGTTQMALVRLTDRDRIFRMQFREACDGKPDIFKLLARKLYEHQKYQLKNSYIIADEKGEPANNMNIEDICPLLAKLMVVEPEQSRLHLQ